MLEKQDKWFFVVKIKWFWLGRHMTLSKNWNIPHTSWHSQKSLRELASKSYWTFYFGVMLKHWITPINHERSWPMNHDFIHQVCSSYLLLGKEESGKVVKIAVLSLSFYKSSTNKTYISYKSLCIFFISPGLSDAN